MIALKQTDKEGEPQRQSRTLGELPNDPLKFKTFLVCNLLFSGIPGKIA